ncbi:MAG TPA: hypothetical protein GX513_12485 [Firmicutes bacterium]|nr:hypothetical protein [Bacillota bacterium]
MRKLLRDVQNLSPVPSARLPPSMAGGCSVSLVRLEGSCYYAVKARRGEKGGG